MGKEEKHPQGALDAAVELMIDNAIKAMVKDNASIEHMTKTVGIASLRGALYLQVGTYAMRRAKELNEKIRGEKEGRNEG